MSTNSINDDRSEGLAPPELTAEQVLRVDDDRFTTDNVAVVTGAASGIGQATAVALAANGLTVAGLDIDEMGLEETIEIADSIGVDGRTVAASCDLTDDAAAEGAIEAAVEEGSIRYLANIAGM